MAHMVRVYAYGTGHSDQRILEHFLPAMDGRNLAPFRTPTKGFRV